MAHTSYIKITGSKQGLITKGATTAESIGNTYQEGHEDQAMVFDFATNITVPRDPQSGQPTGARVHGPMRVIKQLDKSTPLLGQAICSGEVLSDIELECYRTSKTGQVEKFYTVKVTDAVLVSQRLDMYSPLAADTAALPNMEEIAFTYRKIEWTHDKAGTSGTDDWRAPS
jgi:type VI secretion system secreted protein Hcp